MITNGTIMCLLGMEGHSSCLGGVLRASEMLCELHAFDRCMVANGTIMCLPGFRFGLRTFIGDLLCAWMVLKVVPPVLDGLDFVAGRISGLGLSTPFTDVFCSVFHMLNGHFLQLLGSEIEVTKWTFGQWTVSAETIVLESV